MLLMLLLVSGLVAKATGLPDTGMLPDSPFYFLKQSMENLNLMLTFDQTAKAELHLKFAELRLAESSAMMARGKPELAVKMMAQYEAEVGQANAIGDQAQDPAVREQIYLEVSEATYRHIQVIDGLMAEGNLPEEAQVKLSEAKQRSLRGHDVALDRLSDLNPQSAEQLRGEQSDISQLTQTLCQVNESIFPPVGLLGKPDLPPEAAKLNINVELSVEGVQRFGELKDGGLYYYGTEKHSEPDYIVSTDSCTLADLLNNASGQKLIGAYNGGKITISATTPAGQIQLEILKQLAKQKLSKISQDGAGAETGVEGSD